MAERIQLAISQDLPFLQEMLYEAAYWRSDNNRPPLDDALKRPDLVKLLAGWGRPGDAAFIATAENGTPVGAAWYRYWTPEDHSYGFVNSATPELGIGVKSTHRRRGIGSALLDSLLDHARNTGIEQLSLSVEIENPARHLYQKLGFEPMNAIGGAWTMIATLTRELL